MSHKYRQTFLRQWREHKGLTLVYLAEQLGMTHGQLSKIERGLQPYSQGLLEKLAEMYDCDVIDLLSRDPTDTGEIWSEWNSATEEEKGKILSIVRMVRGGSDERPAAN